MKTKIGIFFGIIVFATILSWQFFEDKTEFHIMLEKSGPYIGIENPNNSGFDGSGIKIAIIDTGVDYNHPDLFGLGSDGKVVGGYDFVDNDMTPLDTNGHGTEVAG
ncbi:MAG: S8 family serine peptidase, partial [Nitrosopumilaceae archaeon]